MATKKKAEVAVEEKKEIKAGPKKAPKKEVKTVVVNVAKLNVRKDPSLAAEIARIVKRGDKLELVEDQGEWLKLKGGYVRAEYVSM